MLHQRLLADEKLRKRFDREAELAGNTEAVHTSRGGRDARRPRRPLWPRYLEIKTNDVIATPEKRAEAHRVLTALRNDINAVR